MVFEAMSALGASTPTPTHRRQRTAASMGGAAALAFAVLCITGMVQPTAAVNECPVFLHTGDVTVSEDAGPQRIENFCYAVTPGSNEGEQQLQWVMTTADTSLFTEAPKILWNYTFNTTAALIFTPLPNAFGSTTVSIVAKDNGGVSGGGCDTSTANAFTLTINAVNDAPSFGFTTTSIDVNEDVGPVTISNLISSLNKGNSFESAQTLTFNVQFQTPTDSNKFAVAPTLDSTGVLTFTPAQDKVSTAVPIYVQLVDSAGGKSCDPITSCSTFSITISSINDKPTFTASTGTITVWEDLRQQGSPDPAAYTLDWASSILAGPSPSESSQTIVFDCVVTNPGLFTVQPEVFTNGTLAFTLAKHKNGQSTVTVTIRDSGTVGNNTGDVRAVTIDVLSVNDAPIATKNYAEPFSLDRNDALVSFNSFMTAVFPGPSDATDEASQTLSVSIVSSPASLFSTLTASIITGNLMKVDMQPTTNAYGNSSVTITLLDNGGTDRSGVPTLVTILPVEVKFINNDPELTIGMSSINITQTNTEYGTILTGQNKTKYVFPNFITTATPGSGEGSIQTVTCTVNTTNDGAFSVLPNIVLNQQLEFTLPDSFEGTISFTITATDDYSPAATTSQIVVVTIRGINRCPSMVTQGDLTYTEGTTAVSIPNWATSIDKGRVSESSQSLQITVTTGNTSAFSVNPQLIYNSATASGTLTFTLLPQVFGTIEFMTSLWDDGGVSDGGCDSFNMSTKIQVTGVNDRPTMTVTQTSIIVVEGSGTTTLSNWATGIHVGAGETHVQTLSTNITLLDSSQSSIFSALPTLDLSTGDLTFTVASNRNSQGSPIQLKIQVVDTAGQANSANCDYASCPIYSITVREGNVMPSFLGGGDIIVWEELRNVNPVVMPPLYYHANWASSISVGPIEESTIEGQTYSFQVTNNATSLFTTEPGVFVNGTLYFGLQPNQNGVAELTVTLYDTGASPNNGTSIDVIVQVLSVNDAPLATINFADPYTFQESAVLATFNTFATGVSPGPTLAADEMTQSLTTTITAVPSDLFSTLTVPLSGSTVTLNIQPAIYRHGNATLYFDLKDDGGQARGGVDTFRHNFTVNIDQVNIQPFFIFNSSFSMLEDSSPGGFSFVRFATNISAGNLEDQVQSLTFTCDNTNKDMFLVQPTLDISGTLSFHVKDHLFGSSAVSCDLKDDGVPPRTKSGSFSVIVGSVNDCPSFVSGGDITVLESVGLVRYPTWATQVSAGPQVNEGNQTLTWTVNTADPTLFDINPTIDWSITNSSIAALKFAPKAEAYGVTTVTIYVTDDGGRSDGGCDTSQTASILINIKEVNQKPSFVFGTNRIEVDEDAGAQSVSGWATAISTGATNEASQSLWFDVVFENSTQTDLFSTVPAISSSTGALTYEFKPNANTFSGEVRLRVRLYDNGNTSQSTPSCEPLSNCNVLTLVCRPVNDLPYFTQGIDVTVWEDLTNFDPVPANRTYVIPNWATTISTGNTWEKDVEGQTYTFGIVFTTTTIFAVQPSIDSSGTLTMVFAANQNGATTMTVSITDSGALPNKGTTVSVTVTVLSVNNAPTLYLRQSEFVVNEDCGPTTLNNWVLSPARGPSAATDEASQTITFELTPGNATVYNSSLFSVAPAVNAADMGDIKLTFTPAPNAFGTARLTLVLRDDGGTARGGVDRIFNELVITVNPVNDIPSFTLALATLDVVEDCGPQIASGIIADVDPGSLESQVASIILSNDRPDLFQVQPNLTLAGTLQFEPKANAVGVARIDISVKDNAPVPLTSAQQRLTLTIAQKNDAPSFVLPSTSVNVSECQSGGKCTFSFVSFLTSASAGPPNNEGSQTITYSVAVPVPAQAMFSAQPQISTSGQLDFTLLPTKNTYHIGSQRIVITATDTGGVANGGVATFSLGFDMIIIPTISAPTMSLTATTITTSEDSGTVVTPQWITNINRDGYDKTVLVCDLIMLSGSHLFAALPHVILDFPNSEGSLTFTTKPNEFGDAYLVVALRDPEMQQSTANVSVTITLRDVNDPPTFDVVDAAVYEETTSFSGLAALNIKGGPLTEGTTQGIKSVTISCPTITPSPFTVDPVITSNGQVSFSLTSAARGSISCTIAVQDDGGVTLGGVDTTTKVFNINILSFNHPPSFTKGGDITVYEDSGPYLQSSWATALSAGTGETQQMWFVVTCSKPEIFKSLPNVTSDGTFTFEPLADANGVSACQIYLQDDGSNVSPHDNMSPVVQVTVTVVSVNDAPTFTRGSNLFLTAGEGLRTIAQWATNISAGPADEQATQGLSFTVNTSAFPQGSLVNQPTIIYSSADKTAQLRVEFGTSFSGTWTTGVCLVDTGGTTVTGDVDQTCTDVTFSIAHVNQMPTFSFAPVVSILESATAFTLTGWLHSQSPGLGESEQQTISSMVFACPTSLAENSVLQSWSLISNGNLILSAVPEVSGSVGCNVTVVDSLGGVTVEQVQVRVLAVNNAPSFQGLYSTMTVDQGETVSAKALATNLKVGPPDESSQVLAFSASLANGNLTNAFATLPTVDSSGLLDFSVSPTNYFGSVVVNVYAYDDGGTLNGGQDKSTTFQLTIYIRLKNTAPSFLPGLSVIVLEDSGPYSSIWATKIAPGAEAEAAQDYSFAVNCNNSLAKTLFSSPPGMTNAGTLSFTPAPNQFGSLTCDVIMTDVEGLTSQTNLDLNVVNVNDAPDFIHSGNVSLKEDSIAVLSKWAVGITAGPMEDSVQTVQFLVSRSAAMIQSASVNDTTGNLLITPVPNVTGWTPITVVLQDNGGTENNGVSQKTVTIWAYISPVNDPPVVQTLGNVHLDVTPPQKMLKVPGWLAYLAGGPGDTESHETVTVSLVASNTSLFSVQPYINISDGRSLNFAVNTGGSSPVSLRAVDSTGQVTTSSFTITISRITSYVQFTPLVSTMDIDAGSRVTVPFAGEFSADVVSFSLSIDNANLFVVAPSVNPNGELSFVAGNGHGTAVFAVEALGHQGERSKAHVLTVTIKVPIAVRVAMLTPFEAFDETYFKQVVSNFLNLTTIDQVVILSVSPGSTIVEFYVRQDNWTTTALTIARDISTQGSTPATLLSVNSASVVDQTVIISSVDIPATPIPMTAAPLPTLGQIKTVQRSGIRDQVTTTGKDSVTTMLVLGLVFAAISLVVVLVVVGLGCRKQSQNEAEAEKQVMLYDQVADGDNSEGDYGGKRAAGEGSEFDDDDAEEVYESSQHPDDHHEPHNEYEFSPVKYPHSARKTQYDRSHV